MTTADPASSGESIFEPELLDRLVPGRLFDLHGKVACVTGAAGGIGKWLSAGFAAAGASVLITDREPEALAAVAAAILGVPQP